MKKMVRRRLSITVIIGMLLTLLLNYYLQLEMIHRDVETESMELFWQIEQILEENSVEAQKVTEEFQRECLVKAKAAAYIIENQPEVLESQQEMERIAELLQMDELHIFDETGTIYAGSVPKYFGYNFNSGEQMQFFLPMMEDRTLELCQPVTPNTAEGKLMQYAAVWREDGKGIVQIGMEPVRVLEVTKKNELSYIFSLLTESSGAKLYAVREDTYEILGSTDEARTGETLMDLGFAPEKIRSDGEGFHENVDGKPSYCIFSRQSGEDGILLGRVYTASSLYHPLYGRMLLLAVYLLALAVIMIWSSSHYLERNIVQGISDLNSKLQNITNGDMETTVDVRTTPEFVELSGYINRMLESLDRDMLTGLYTRRVFYSQVQELLKQPETLRHAALIVMDTDNLKYVNDNYGHEAGDCYLQGMGVVLDSNSAPNQLTARIGGDEFAMFVYGCESREELQGYVMELRNKQEGFHIGFHPDIRLMLKFSMGCAFYGEDGTSYRLLAKCADERMYEAKRLRKEADRKGMA